MKQPETTKLRIDLVRAASEFTVDALTGLDPHLSERVALFAMHVLVRCSPPKVRLLIEAPDEEIRVVHSADQIPSALGIAVAAVVEAAVAQLDPARRARVAQLEQAGYSLSVSLECATGIVRIMIDAGAQEPVVLAAIGDAEPKVFH